MTSESKESGSKRSRTIFVSCLLLFLITLFLTLFAVVSHFSERNRKVEDGRKNARKAAETAAREIDLKLQEFQKLAEDIANDLTQKPNSIKLEQKEIRRKIEIYWDQYPELSLTEIGFAFKPYSYDSSIRLYGEVFRKIGEITEWIDLDALYDYDKDDRPETRWYHQAISRNKGDWGERLFLSKDKRLMATYSLPFYKYYSSESKGAEKKGTAKVDYKEVAGVVYLRYPVENHEELFHSHKLEENGYAFLLSKQGFFISHPTLEYDKDINIDTLAKKPAYSQFDSLCKNAIDNINTDRKVEGDFRDPVTNQSSWIVFETIPSTQWRLGTVLMDSDFISLESSRQSLTHIGILIALSLTFLIALFLKVYRGGPRKIWILSSCVSLFCIVIVIQTLYFHWQAPNTDGENVNKITNQYSLKQFQKETRTRMLEQGKKLPIYIPTGIYVQSISFARETGVRLTGYIWQKYDGIPADVERGVIIMGGETKEMEKVFTKKTGREELIRWKFTVVLYKEFDYAHYPLRWENIRIQLRQKSLQEHIIPVPDLDAYNLANPGAKPGIPAQTVLPGWKIDKTSFNLGIHDPMTNFSLGDNARGGQFPDLYFNVFIKKEFIGSALSRMMPIFLVIVLIFILLMLTHRFKQKRDTSSFSGMNVVIACVAFFLVAVLSQANLKNALPDYGVIYLEYFYFITYILIFGVTINALLFNRGEREIPFIQFRENFIPRVLYWPVCTFMILLVTLAFFY